MSPSTISHQVRDLEAFLGLPLFSRSGRAVTLTVEGEQYLAPLKKAFDLIRSASITTHSHDQLRIGAFPFLANEILTPRLAQLRAAVPDKQIKLHTETELDLLLHVDPAERVDVIVRYGPGNASGSVSFPGMLATRLFDVSIVPMQASSEAPITDSDDVMHRPLIHVIGPFDGWKQWTETFAPDHPSRSFAIETDSFHAAALAVERGDGICLGVLPYIRPWVAAGRVQLLSQFELPLNQAAYAVYAPHNQNDPAISAFADWLVAVLA